MKAYEQVSICRVFWNVPGNKNRFESLSSPVVSMSNIVHGPRSNNLNIFDVIHGFRYQVLALFMNYIS